MQASEQSIYHDEKASDDSQPYDRRQSSSIRSLKVDSLADKGLYNTDQVVGCRRPRALGALNPRFQSRTCKNFPFPSSLLAYLFFALLGAVF
jgi:hypothetical protein